MHEKSLGLWLVLYINSIQGTGAPLLWGGAGSWDCWAQRRIGEDLIYGYKHLKGKYKEDGANLFSVVPSARATKTRGSGQMLGHKRFCLNARKHIVMWVAKHWHRLPRDCGVSCLGELLKPPTCKCGPRQPALHSLAWGGGWTRCPPEVSSHLNHSLHVFF